MGVDDLKLYLLNASSFVLASLNWIEPALEILLLALTIGYTVHKWLLIHKNKEMRSINEIIVHCSATREGQHIPVETIKGSGM